ncbi:MAG TPA: GNAT family N-acetyltransferase [Povalibacter sp.]|nr:GNAT family N-acetyltransferase [Povalibacter sp.]
MDIIRCRSDFAAILDIINSAAAAYRGVIPQDCWHEPYMAAAELQREVAAGVEFRGAQIEGELAGVMGLQSAGEVDLIRHAYVLPGQQRRGIGAGLIEHLKSSSSRRMLVGTWSAAQWAVDFYRRHGFVLVPQIDAMRLLRAHWDIKDRQIETSVVLVLER